MEILIALFIVFAIVTVVGHVIWIAFAALFRALGGTTDDTRTELHLSQASSRQPQFCIRCGASLRNNSNLCFACGHRQDAPINEVEKNVLNDLAATERQLQRFRTEGILDEVKFNWLLRIVKDERARLTQTPTPPPPAQEEKSVPVSPPLRIHEPIPTPEIKQPESLSQPQTPRAEEKISAAPFDLPPAQIPVAEKAVQKPVQKPAPVIAPPKPPRKSFAEMLTAFMEEKNIRWGELVGGALIIGCSLALVISLWAQIEQIPLLKFFIFTAMTGAFAGLGFYSEHRWKLPNTSRGLLITATLLVPLNFLAISAFANEISPRNPMVIASEIVALLLFGFIVQRAGKLITPGNANWLLLGAVGTATTQLLLRRLATSETATIGLCLLAALPIACYAAAIFGWRKNLSRDENLEVPQAHQAFTLLSTSSFAALVSLGLLLFKTGRYVDTLQRLAPMISLLAIPALFAGLTLWQKVKNSKSQYLFLVSTSIAVFSALTMLASLIFAWPQATIVMIVALINFAAITAAAFIYRLPAAHWLALSCLTVASLLGVNLALGHIHNGDSSLRLFRAMLSTTSGSALAILFLLIGGVGEFLRIQGRKDDSKFYAWAAGAIAVISFALVTIFGFGQSGDPAHITWVYAVLAASAFYVAWRLQFDVASLVGCAMLFLACTQFLYFGLQQSFKFTTLIFASVTLIAAASLRKFAVIPKNVFALPIQHASLITAIACASILLLTAPVNTASTLSAQTFWLALIVASLAWLYRSPALFTAFQAITYGTVFLTVTAALHNTQILAELPVSLRALRPQMIALACLSPLWIVLRLSLRKLGITREQAITQDAPVAWHDTAARLLYPEWLTCDQVVTWALIACFAALSIFGVLPGSLHEIAPQSDLVIKQLHFSAVSEWLLLGALVFVLTISLWEQFTQWRILGLLFLGALICPLLAQASAAPASMLRWTLAIYVLLTAGAIWGRDRLYHFVAPLQFPLLKTASSQLTEYARAFTFLLAGLPILGLTLLHFSVSNFALPLDSIFARFSTAIIFAVPLLALSVVLVGHAIRERVTAYAFGGGLILNLTATLLFLHSASVDSATNKILLLQINAITSAGFALAWIGVRLWWQRRQAQQNFGADSWLKIQAAIGLIISLFLIGLGGLSIFVTPYIATFSFLQIGQITGWLAFVLSCATVASLQRLRGKTFSLANISISLFATSILVACSLSRPLQDKWLAYHTMLTASLASAGFVLFAGFRQQFAATPRATILLTNIFGALSLLLGLRALGGDPYSPWWTIATCAVLSLLAIGLAKFSTSRGYVYVAGILVNVAVTIWHFFGGQNIGLPLLDLVTLNVLTLALTGLALFAFEKKILRADQSPLPAFHHFAALVSLLALLLPVSLGLATNLRLMTVSFSAPLAWSALTATIILMTANLWDATAKFVLAGLYTLGLLTIAMTLEQANFVPRDLMFAATIAGGLYALFTSLASAQQDKLIVWANALHIPRHNVSANNWLVATNTMLIAGTTFFATAITLEFALFSQRAVAALAVLLQAASFALLARGTKHPATRSPLQTYTFAVGIYGAILCGWSLLQPGAPLNFIARVAVVLIVSLLAVEIIGLWFIKRFANDWSHAAKRLIIPLCGFVAVSLSLIFFDEITQQIFSGAVVMPMFAIIAAMLILFGLCLQAIYFAVRADSDPLQLSERGRMNYVYASEALLALTFLHIRLTMPWLFTGFFERYWPFVVMVLAFLGVGLGEIFRRRGQRVLGQPLLNTGFFLPIFPVIGFWLAASRVNYSGLLLLVGILYGAVAVLRSSFGISLLACFAANGSLWYFLSKSNNYGLLQRPQLWLTPAAISVLLAAYFNRDRLSARQLTNLRYLTLSVIYVSSTAEIFMRGVAQSPWQPLVLMILSAGGVLAGILLRVRAFLYLGSSFLGISILTMIWHAAANFGWTWLWYVTGIALGLAIILLFALFEKKREDLLRLVAGLRSWEA